MTLRSEARKGYKVLNNAGALGAGFRYSRSLPSPTGENVRDSDDPGRLGAYFDAHASGPGLWKWRHYFPIYERHFAPFVGRQPHVVEIGIYSGGSLPMWLDYFGDGAH